MYNDEQQPQLRRNKTATARKGGAVVKREDNRALRAARHSRKDRIEAVRQREMMES